MTEYTISVDDELWRKFKRVVTRDKTMNEVINELIKKRVENVKS